jgi:RNA polymerase subunit RPABC4/transcription elongation factor Spt4
MLSFELLSDSNENVTEDILIGSNNDDWRILKLQLDGVRCTLARMHPDSKIKIVLDIDKWWGLRKMCTNCKKMIPNASVICKHCNSNGQCKTRNREKNAEITKVQQEIAMSVARLESLKNKNV